MGYLNQYTRRRVAAVLLVLGIVVAALAIADAGPFEDPPTPEDLAEDATRAFFAAGAAEDYEKACSLMTKTKREEIERQFALLGAEEDLEGCPALLELAREELADPELEVLEVSVSGPNARVEVKHRIEGQGRVQRSVTLGEVSPGRWKVSDPGFD